MDYANCVKTGGLFFSQMYLDRKQNADYHSVDKRNRKTVLNCSIDCANCLKTEVLPMIIWLENYLIDNLRSMVNKPTKLWGLCYLQSMLKKLSLTRSTACLRGFITTTKTRHIFRNLIGDASKFAIKSTKTDSKICGGVPLPDEGDSILTNNNPVVSIEGEGVRAIYNGKGGLLYRLTIQRWQGCVRSVASIKARLMTL